MKFLQAVGTTILEQLKKLAEIIPNLIGAIVVFFIGWIIARIISKIVGRFLRSIRLDQLAEKLNEIEIVHKSNIKLVPSVVLSKIVYYLLLFIFFTAAVDVLGMKAISDLMTGIMNYIPNAISAMFVLVIGILLADALKNIVLTTCKSLNIPAASLIANLVFYFIFLNVVMITLKQANLQTTFMETNISIILGGVVLAFAIGYGFASQGLMTNFIANFYNKEKVRIGDTISIEGVKGEVVDIDNSTFTLQIDDRKVVFPLGKLTSEKYEIYDKKS